MSPDSITGVNIIETNGYIFRETRYDSGGHYTLLINTIWSQNKNDNIQCKMLKYLRWRIFQNCINYVKILDKIKLENKALYHCWYSYIDHNKLEKQNGCDGRP